jgi:hypothetical protein
LAIVFVTAKLTVEFVEIWLAFHEEGIENDGAIMTYKNS